MLGMSTKTVWRNYLSFGLQMLVLHAIIEELLELLRERPGFTDEFDQITQRVMRRNKNSVFPPGVAIEDEAYAATHNIENLNHIFKKCRRDLRKGKRPT